MCRYFFALLITINFWLPVKSQSIARHNNPWRDDPILGKFLEDVRTSLRIEKQSVVADSSIPLLPGWPVKVGLWPQHPVVADLTGNGKYEVIVADMNGYLHVLTINGQYLSSSWPMRLGTSLSSPAIADINNDSVLEIIVVEVIGLDTEYSPNGRVHVLNAEGEYLNGWPYILDGAHERINSVSISDLDNDGYKDIVTATGTSTGIGIDTIRYSMKVYALGHTGSPLPGWPVDPENNTDLKRGPRSPMIIVDLDKDGYHDIVSGFSYFAGSSVSGSAVYAFRHDGVLIPGYFPVETEVWNYAMASADMNNDGEYEIFSHGRRFRSNGFNDIDWKIQENVFSELAFADVDQDGLPELIYGTGGYHAIVNVVDQRGNSLSGWPVYYTDDIVDGNPVAGDIDGDGDIEILIGTHLTNNIFAWHHDGTAVAGFPLTTGGSNSRIALSDLDGDGDIELISACEDSLIYIWDIPSSGPCTNLEWPMYQHDMRHTGVYPSSFTNVVDEKKILPPTNFILELNYPNPFNGETHIPYTLSGREEISLAVYDLRGRKVCVLEQGVKDAGQYEAVWQGKDDAGKPVSSGIYLTVLRVGERVERRKVVLVK